MLELNPGITGKSFRLFKAAILLASGKPQAALVEIDAEKTNVVEGSGSLASGKEILRALAYDNLGRNVEADRQLVALKQDHSSNKPFAIGLLYANRGKIDQAFDWFDWLTSCGITICSI
jgi:hypothetical protein